MAWGEGKTEEERILDILAERLEMGSMVATDEEFALSGDQARFFASWLMDDLRRAGVTLDLA